jgi:uncharacterized protein YbjT (DUF2867 family)
MKRILVTGASGRVGRHIARRLARENVDLRLGFSSPQGLKTNPEVWSMLGNYNDAGQMAKVFSSIDAAFLYAPEVHASKAVFNAARQAGVRQVVLLSSASVIKAPPGTNPIAERHRAAENAAIEAGLDWTFIRPDTMASNCLQWAAGIRAEGRVYTPYPESMRSAVHEDDIALLAVSSLIGSQYLGRAFYLTGDRLLTIRAQVQIIAEQLGQDVQCVQISPDEALQRMTANQIQSPQAAARILDYLKKSVTVPPGITDDFEQATGCAPKSFDQWVEDNLDHFRPDTSSAPPAPPAPPAPSINHPHR